MFYIFISMDLEQGKSKSVYEILISKNKGMVRSIPSYLYISIFKKKTHKIYIIV